MSKLTDNQQLSNDVENTISLIANEGKEGVLSRLRLNFLSLAFREFVASDFFTSTDRKIKAEFVEDYQSLIYLLEQFDTLATTYPDLCHVHINASINNN